MIFGTQKPWVISTKALVHHRASARDQQLRVSAPGQVGSILEIWIDHWVKYQKNNFNMVKINKPLKIDGW